MRLIRNNLDTLEGICRSTKVMSAAFASLEHAADPFALVSEYRNCIEEQLKNFDEKMCSIMDDLNDRTTWADRMRNCHKMMRVLTMNLAFWGKPEWNWNEVSEAMAYLRAVAEGAEATLMTNEPEQTEGTTAP